jgi:hypothetical protein
VEQQQMLKQVKELKALTQPLVLSHQLAEAMVVGEAVHQMYLQVEQVAQAEAVDVLIIQIPMLEIQTQELETKVVFLQ